MANATQTCRICGGQIPSGFTYCDGCYFKMAETNPEKIKGLKPPSNLKKPRSKE